MDVYLSQWPGRQMIFAFAANQGLETCISGDCSPDGESADSLIRADVPPGTHHGQLVHDNALFLPSVIVTLITLLVYGLLLFRDQWANREGARDHAPTPPAASV
jgi:hypothetical protein